MVYQSLFASLALQAGVFDVSLNGAMRLTELAKDGTGIIADYFRDKAIVMLNNEFVSANDEQLRAITMARAGDMIEALTMNSWTFFAKPKAKWIANRAKSLQAELNKKYPERNFFVVHRFDGELLKRGYFTRTWR